MQITTEQAQICILALETCGITEQPEQDEIAAVHHYLRGNLMNDLQFRAMERNGKMPMNAAIQPDRREQKVQELLALNMACCKAYDAACDLQSQPSDDAALVAAAANFEAALREVV